MDHFIQRQRIDQQVLANRNGATVVIAAALTTLFLLLTAVANSGSPVHAQGNPQFTIDLDLQNRPTTVQPGDVITQRIRLGYTGGEVTIDAGFLQELPPGLRPITLPIVTESTAESVRPLTVQRRGRTWGWQGKMQPEALLTVVMPLRVQQCYGDDRTLTLNVTARRLPNGVERTDSVSLTVDCLNGSISDITVTDRIIYRDGTQSDGTQNDGNRSDSGATAAGNAAVQAVNRFYLPGTNPTLRITLRNDSADPLTIGTSGAAKCCRCLTCTVTANLFADDLAVADTTEFRRFVLQPGESGVIEQPMTGAPAVNDPGDTGEYSYGGELTYCLIGEEADSCPNPATVPQLAAVHTIDIPVRASDLGDAPDSTNHTAGLAAIMLAYPAVQANFPTVFDPATGLEQGPRHIYPQFLHLGKRVSREAEADLGPDQDPQNNILPVADTSDNERGDDGANPATWSLQHCRATQVPVEVYIAPAAVTWFQQQGKQAYLNGWLDANRDGDWADVTTCQDGNNQAQIAVEHMIIDHPIDVAALGSGIHTINVPTGIVSWATAQAQQPAWVRLTLSERPANKPLTVGERSYGDGRGHTSAFRTGETEDYLLQPTGSADAGPDVEVQLAGVVEEVERITESSAARQDSLVVDFQVRYSIGYANRGSSTATGALLEFQLPEGLLEVPPTILRHPGIAADQVAFDNGTIRFALPDLRAGSFGKIVLGWTGCLTCTLTTRLSAANLATPEADFAASAIVTLASDTDDVNNQASVRPSRVLIGAGVGGFYTTDPSAWRQRGVTCQDTVTFAGRGRPGATVLVQLDALSAHSDGEDELHAATTFYHWREPLTATVQIGPNGIWKLTQSGLPDGTYRVRAGYRQNGLHAAAPDRITFDRGYLSPALYLTVDPSLVLDPLSFTLTDSTGRAYFPPVTSRLGNFEIQDLMVAAPGEYTASALSCPGRIVEAVQFNVGDVVVDATQVDDDCEPKGSDACGPWRANIVIPGGIQRTIQGSEQAAGQGGNTFAIHAATAVAESTFSGTLSTGTPAIVTNPTGEPLAAAEVTLLAAVPTAATDSDGNVTTGLIYIPWNGADYGQSNPVTTGTDGSYSFTAPAGLYRLQVQRSGYQPYISTEIEQTESTLLADDVTLSPAITATAAHLIEITESGFSPAALTVTPGSIVEFINVDFMQHGTRSTLWDSGLLNMGAGYKVQLDTLGTYVYEDSTNPLQGGTIVVAEETEVTDQQIFLPVIVR